MYAIEIVPAAVEELAHLPAFDGRAILAAIRRHLALEPTVESARRKELRALRPPFEAEPPIWELRVGEFRVFYDVNEERKKVYVRAVRRKPPHRTTEEIL